jgi:hypothetical protein
MDLILIVDDSEDRRATKVLNRVKRGEVVLLFFGDSFESLYLRGRKGMAQRMKSRLINLTAGARQENSRMVAPDERLDCILFISFSR